MTALRVAAAGDNLADAWRSVVPPLGERPGGSVLIIGGGAQSIGLYAAGLAVAHGAGVVDYLDDDPARRNIAESLGARPCAGDLPAPRQGARSLRHRGRGFLARPGASPRDPVALAPAASARRRLLPRPWTRVPLMRMYATDATLHIGVSHARAVLPELLAFVERTGFPAERVTSLTADWNEAPLAYAARTTKVVLQRDPLTAS